VQVASVTAARAGASGGGRRTERSAIFTEEVVVLRKHMNIDVEERTDAPDHRRWRATARLPDGSERETFAETWEDLLRRVRDHAWIEATCAHPDCAEPCTSDHLCRGCRGYVCSPHDGDPKGPHVVEDHWKRVDLHRN